MNNTTKIALSSVVNGLIAGGGAILALLSSLETGQELDSLGQAPIWIAIGTGIMTALKDIQAFLTGQRKLQ